MDDRRFLARAFQLAKKGLYTADPNPRVGCVLVRDGRILAEGFHRQAGEPNAEANALANATESVVGATAYVTLEPCVMCAGASYWTQLKKVVYGATDEKRGFKAMAGHVFHPKTELVGGIMARECGQIITDFFASKRQLK